MPEQRGGASSDRGRLLPVFARYCLLQIPGMFLALVVLSVLVHWEQISVTLAYGLFGLWVLKDLVMFPVTRIAYETAGAKHGAEALVGALAVAQDELAPGRTGYVRVGAELWKAAFDGTEVAPKDTPLRVTEVRGLTLHVVRLDV